MSVIKISVALVCAAVLAFTNTAQVFARDAMYRAQNDVLYSEDGCDTAGSGGAQSQPTAATGDGGGCGGSAEENKQQIWNFLRGKGLSEEAAAGIMGNMEQESGFMPTADNNKTMGFVDNTGRGCRGIVQWCHERNSGLDSFAAERGKSWDCLGLQLEYLWHEMTETDQGRYNGNGDYLEIPLPDALNGGDFSRKSNYTGSGAYNAGAIFHDYFERANTAAGEHLGRGERAEEIYREFTGKEATPLAASENKGPGSTQQCKTNGSGSSGGQNGNGAIPSEDCAKLIKRFNELVAQGKITLVDPSRQEKDLQNCTTDQIECGTGGGKGGVNPSVLRAVVAAAENTGDGAMELWSFNTGHDCDGLNHPHGKAIDIKCDGNVQGQTTASEKCNRIFKYLYDHYDELHGEELIWQYPPSEYSCSDPKIMCNVDGHGDHIHFGVQ